MTHHGACLRSELITEGMPEDEATANLEAVCGGRAAPQLAGADLAIIGFATKLTRTPREMTEPDVARLREHGFSDRAIYDITSITAFFAYVNRVAQGLGVPLEPNWEQLLRPTTSALSTAKPEPEG